MSDTLTDKLKRAVMPDVKGNRFFAPEGDTAETKESRSSDKSAIAPPDYITLAPIDFRGGKYMIDIDSRPTQDLKKYTAKSWMRLTNNRDWQIPNTHIFTALVQYIYGTVSKHFGLGPSEVHQVKALIAEDLQEGILTSTEISYQTNKQIPGNMICTVSHNTGSTIRSAADYNLASTTSPLPDKLLTDIFGTANILQVEQAYRWITGHPPELKLHEQVPNRNKTSPVILKTEHGRSTYLYATASPLLHYRARLVRVDKVI